MGVYHISGLGTSPGALTMPLTVVYLLQVAQLRGDDVAIQFFSSSGEKRSKSGSREKLLGVPEYLIILTSNEIVEGKIPLRYRSSWFGIPKTNKKECIEKILSLYFKKLGEYFERVFGYDAIEEIIKKLKGVYILEVKHDNFEDCFFKAGITLKALGSITSQSTIHEIWANMVAGTNQINSAILMAGAYTSAVARYYYLFQSFENTDLLEPEWIDKPKKNIPSKMLLQRWNELPIFSIDISPILLRIAELFQDRVVINIGEFEQALKDEIDKLRSRENAEIWYYSDRILNRQFLAKLVGKIVLVTQTKVRKGPMFDKIIGIWKEIDKADVKTFSDWEKWAKNKGILHEVKL